MLTGAEIQQRFEAICEEELNTLAEAIRANIETKVTNSSNLVNSLGLPAYTSGATSASIHTTKNEAMGEVEMSLDGREGIQALDTGKSPSDIRQEFGSYERLFDAIERWARTKEVRYGLLQGEINATNVTDKLWRNGTVLYRAGGGREQIADLLAPTWQRIQQRFSAEIDAAVSVQIDAAFDYFNTTLGAGL